MEDIETAYICSSIIVAGLDNVGFKFNTSVGIKYYWPSNFLYEKNIKNVLRLGKAKRIFSFSKK